jgi:DNA-binding response OmpR family regulator
VLDYQLPELNGLQILYRLMDNENRPPAIMVTAEDDVAIVVEALRLGISDYVIKSTDPNYLSQLPDVCRAGHPGASQAAGTRSDCPASARTEPEAGPAEPRDTDLHLDAGRRSDYLTTGQQHLRIHRHRRQLGVAAQYGWDA